MAPKKKQQPKSKTAVKVPKSRAEAVQECPAYSLCCEKMVDCGICLELDPEKWREHARAVLSQAP
jgi:hypothetical protein